MKKKLVESSLGVKTTEALARKIDLLLPTLPHELRAVRRKSSVQAQTKVEPATRTDISVITTRCMDRDFEIVEPEGFDLKDYLLNPVVFYMHDQTRPVGTCQWIKPEGDGLVGKTLYASRSPKYVGEFFPDYVWSLVSCDPPVLRGKSVGFLPLDFRDPTPEELATYPDLRRVITRSLLLEYSVVSIPSNPEALVEAVGKGMGLDLWNFKVVGKLKPKPSHEVKTATAPVWTKKPLSQREINDEVFRRLRARWEV